MTPPTNIDGTDISGATIDGDDVQEITVDGDTVFFAIPSSGVSRWEFEQDVTDSWNGNDGSGSGISFSTDSATGTYAGDFGGSDYVDVNGVASAISAPVSVSLWLKADNISNTGEIFATKFERFVIVTSFNQANSVEFKIADSNGNSSSASYSASSGTYYHAVATYDTNSTGELYVNGTSRGTLSRTLDQQPEATIGNQVNHNNGFAGLIDDVRVYDKVLSSTEVSNLYQTGSID